MKKLLIVLAVASALHHNAWSQDAHLQLDIAVFGDSLTSPANSWAENIDQWGLAQIRNYAVAGSRLVDTEIPDQLKCRVLGETDATRVILALGTNDAGSRVSIKLYKQKLTDILQFLEGRGCSVFLVKPIQPSFVDSRPYRRATGKIAKRYDNVTVLNMPYNEAQTTDGLHPNAEQHVELARWFIEKLGL